MHSIATDFYLNLDRWEAISTIERDRGRWEVRHESPPARLEPIQREAVFQSARAIVDAKIEPTEKMRHLILSPSPPGPKDGPIALAWCYARAVQFAHGWQKAFIWNQAGMAQLQRIFTCPETAGTEDSGAGERLLELRREAALVGQNAGGVGLIEIGTFIGGMRQVLNGDGHHKHLYMIALRMLVLQQGYIQTLYAPIEGAFLHSVETPTGGALGGGRGEEPVGLWLDDGISVLLEVGRMAERAWESLQVAARRSALQEQILSFAHRNGKLTAGQVMQVTGANRNTIKDNLARLVEEGVLTKRGIKRGTVYIPG